MLYVISWHILEFLRISTTLLGFQISDDSRKRCESLGEMDGWCGNIRGSKLLVNRQIELRNLLHFAIVIHLPKCFDNSQFAFKFWLQALRLHQILQDYSLLPTDDAEEIIKTPAIQFTQPGIQWRL